MSKPHETAPAEEFNSYAEEWIGSNLTIAQILSVPGVAERVLEEFNNQIIDAFDEDHDDEETL